MRKANLMMLVLACVSLILSATACGNGQGKPVFNDNSECEQNCPIEISGGDTVDESGESVACEGQNCPEVVADADNECQNCSDTNDTKQEEATQTVCGNGFCEPEGENCQNCSKDCGCPGNTHCASNGACVYETCGNGACEQWEDCGCEDDCPCNNDYTCKMVEKTWCGNYGPYSDAGVTEGCEASGEMVLTCVPPWCGDGECHGNDKYPHEDCHSCPEDCACNSKEVCHEVKQTLWDWDYQCIPTICNYDDTCDSWENCGNCLYDCPCPTGKECQGAGCEWTLPPTCGNSKCEEWENCGSCLVDCGCPETTACNKTSGTCEYVCPADAVMPENCSDTNTPCVCWDFCGFLGEWYCGSYGHLTTYTYFPDIGDGFCHVGPPQDFAVGKPGTNYLELTQSGLQGKAFLSEDGTVWTDPYRTCYKN